MSDTAPATRSAVITDLETDNLLADLADMLHLASTHPVSGVCHGDNDGCEGGPDNDDNALADNALAHVLSDLGLTGPR